MRIVAIIPAFKCPCIQATRVIQQLSPQDRVIILWNNDHDAHRCEKLLSTFSIVKWISAPLMLGAAGARNLAVDSLETLPDAILFCDSDDFVMPNWVMHLALPLLDGRADVVGGMLNICHKRKEQRRIAPSIEYWYRLSLFGGNCGLTPAAWTILKGFDESLLCSEDTDLAWRAADAGLRVHIVAEALINVIPKTLFREILQRWNWGFWDSHLFSKHGLHYCQYPALTSMIHHTTNAGYASYPAIAALGHWTGFHYGRLLQFIK
jgi:GT2 family glycosyltransferase